MHYLSSLAIPKPIKVNRLDSVIKVTKTKEGSLQYCELTTYIGQDIVNVALIS